MPDEAVHRCARREVSPAKVRPDDRVEVRRAPGSFITTWKFRRVVAVLVSRTGRNQAFDTTPLYLLRSAQTENH